MPERPSDPLRRVTLNLYEEDCAYLEQHVGQGWTTWIRDIIHAEARKAMNTSALRYPLVQRRQTLGDLNHHIGENDE